MIKAGSGEWESTQKNRPESTQIVNENPRRARLNAVAQINPDLIPLARRLRFRNPSAVAFRLRNRTAGGRLFSAGTSPGNASVSSGSRIRIERHILPNRTPHALA